MSASAGVEPFSLKSRRISWVLVSYLAIGLVALIPRAADLGDFVTTDESAYWISRSDAFLKGLQTGIYPAKAVTRHPGVTTMWLGSAGIVLRRTLSAWRILEDDAFMTRLALMRVPVVLTHVAGILIGYALLRRLLFPAAALLAALLWAVDPFVIAYSRLLHVDALVATFATLSILAACYYWHHERRPPILVLSGVCAGLAILSKLPGLAVVPVVAAIGFAAPQQHERKRRFITRATRPVLLWAVVCAATVVALWPVLWKQPMQAYDQLRAAVVEEGAEPHQRGNFFLGQAVEDPGVVFYPVALALRLTPWTFLGLLLVPWAWRRASTTARKDWLVMAGFALLFMLALTVFPKKFNRYLVPIFPILDILAAVGLVWIGDWFGGLVRGSGRRLVRVPRRQHIVASCVAVVAVVNVVYWHPYHIAAFNQLFGGARAGARAFVAGWGEGLEQVGAWLNQQRDITQVRVVSPAKPEFPLHHYFRDDKVVKFSDTLPDKAGYVVLYIRNLQGVALKDPFRQFWSRSRPLHVVSIHGVEYAWIYQVPPAVGRELPVDYGDVIHLRGFELDQDNPLTLTLQWHARGKPPLDYMLFAHLIGSDNKRYAQVDIPVATSTWQPERYHTTHVPIPIPPDVPHGKYRLLIGLYDPATGKRMPIGAHAAPVELAGADALLLSEVDLR